MRITNSCVSSEDIKLSCGADKLIYEKKNSFYIFISKNNTIIGAICPISLLTDDDKVIDTISIYDNQTLTDELTSKYRGRILIFSKITDEINTILRGKPEVINNEI